MVHKLRFVCEMRRKCGAEIAVRWCGKGGLDCGFRRLVVLISAVLWCCCGVLDVWFLYDCVANGALGNL